MAEVTVKQLAEVVGTPVERLLEQLTEAGVGKSSADDAVSDDEKMKLLDYLRGKRDNEESRGGALRNRESRLGDFINASPVLDSDTDTIYAAANDGMLHAFDAAKGEDGGEEKFVEFMNGATIRSELEEEFGDLPKGQGVHVSGEHDEAVLFGVVSEELRSFLVSPDATEHAAERRVHQPPSAEERENQHREREVVDDCGLQE